MMTGTKTEEGVELILQALISKTPAMCRFLLIVLINIFIQTAFKTPLTEYGDYANPPVLLHSQKDIVQTPFVARSLW